MHCVLTFKDESNHLICFYSFWLQYLWKVSAKIALLGFENVSIRLKGACGACAGFCATARRTMECNEFLINQLVRNRSTKNSRESSCKPISLSFSYILLAYPAELRFYFVEGISAAVRRSFSLLPIAIGICLDLLLRSLSLNNQIQGGLWCAFLFCKSVFGINAFKTRINYH